MLNRLHSGSYLSKIKRRHTSSQFYDQNDNCIGINVFVLRLKHRNERTISLSRNEDDIVSNSYTIEAEYNMFYINI